MWEADEALQPTGLLQRGKGQMKFVQESTDEDIKLFCYYCVKTLWKADTQTPKNLKHPPSLPDSDILVQEKENAKPRTDKSFQQTVSQSVDRT